MRRTCICGSMNVVFLLGEGGGGLGEVGEAKMFKTEDVFHACFITKTNMSA